MADHSWLDNINISSVQWNTSTGAVEIDQPEVFGLWGQTFLVTLYSLTTFFALIGNTLVILVEIYGRRSARNLQKFLINLAISDLLLGVLVTPFVYTKVMLGRWIFPPFLCPATQFVQSMSIFVTTYTLTFIGIERYFATLHPLSSANTWLRSHGNLVLQLGWLFGAILASFSIRYTRVVPSSYGDQIYCKIWVDINERDIRIYVASSFVLTFVLPIIFLTISYGAIGRRLMRTQKYWCSYKQTVPFSQHSASRTQSSLNNNNNNGAGIVGGGSSSSSNESTSGANANGGGGGGSGSVTTGFIRNKPSRQSIKIKTPTSATEGASGVYDSIESGSRHSVATGSVGGSGTGKTPTTTTAMNGNKHGDPNNKVVVRFDKRNTEFLNKMRVFRLLVAVLFLFIICWLPIKIFMLVLAFFPSIVYISSMTGYYIYYSTYFLCHWLSMANSFANPILYCFMSKSFRADLVDLFICICTRLNICIKSCETLQGTQPYTYTHQRHFNGVNYRLASIKEIKDDKDLVVEKITENNTIKSSVAIHKDSLLQTVQQPLITTTDNGGGKLPAGKKSGGSGKGRNNIRHHNYLYPNYQPHPIPNYHHHPLSVVDEISVQPSGESEAKQEFVKISSM